MISRIGKYTVEKDLGHGGFGDVFLAFDPDVGQRVALKLLRVGLGLDPEMLRRFQHEIRTTASLRHKNIVTIFASGIEEGNPYLVMEFLEGRTLKDIIQTHQPLGLLEKVGIMTQVAEGLAYAHSKGIVHRDVKPENIMLLPDDSVKIMDFGIALAADRNTTMTKTGGIIGTPPYFAPEQIEGYKANEQTDIFSLGVVYYELLTGAHPFEAFKHDWKALQLAIATYDPPPAGQLAPVCPEALESLVRKMIAKAPEHRYRSFSDLLPDNNEILADLQQDRAEALLSEEVQPRFDARDFEGALAKIREVLKLHPGNRKARQLRDDISQQMQKARVPEFLAQAEALMAARQFSEAVECLEAAVKLDSANAGVHVRLVQAKARLDSSERARRLVSEARSKQQKGQVTEALARLKAALAIDPDHPDAMELRPRVQEQMEQQRAERQQQAIQTASEHVAAKRFSEALTVLAQFEQEHPGVSEIARLRARIEQSKDEDERRLRTERFNLAVTETQRAMQAGDLDRASQMIDHLFANFAAEPGAADVLPALREQLNAQIRAQHISACRQEARGLVQKKWYREALGLLDEALAKYPGDTGLHRLKKSTDELYQTHQRSEAIVAVIKEAGGMRDAGDFRGALDAISAARGRIGEEVAFVLLASQLEIEIEQQRYAAGLEELLHAIRELMAGGQYSQAIDRIALAKEYQGEAEVRALLESARVSGAVAEEHRLVADAIQAERSEAMRQAEIAAIAAQVRECVTQDRLQQAAGELDAARAKYPGQGLWATLQADIDARQAVIRRQLEVPILLDSVRKCLKQGDLRQATAELAAARAKYPGEVPWETVQAEIEAQRELLRIRAEVAELAESVRGCLKRNDVRQAAAELSAARTKYPDESVWATLQAGIDARQVSLREAEVAAAVQSVRGCLQRDDIRQAQQELSAARTKYPGESRLLDLEGEVASRQALLQRQADIAAMAERVRECLGRDDLQQAAANLAAARAQYPDDVLWPTLQAEIGARQAALEAVREKQRRSEAVRKVIEEAQALLLASRIEDAIAILRQAAAQYPGEAQVLELLRSSEEEFQRRQRERELEEVRSQAESLLAQGRSQETIALIEGRYAREQRFEELLARARLELEQQRRREARESSRAQLLSIEHRVQAESRKRKLKELDRKANRIASPYPGDEEIAAIASRIHGRIESALATPATSKPVSWKRIGAGFGAAVAIAAAVLLPRLFHKTIDAVNTIPIEIRTDPPGAAVRVGDRSCVTPNCRFDLKPGSYEVQAALAGYEPKQQQVVFDTSTRLVDLTLQPAPLPPARPGVPPPASGTLVVQARVPDALVYVDNVPRGRTGKDGSLSLPLDATMHEVHVERTGYERPAAQRIRIAVGAEQTLVVNLVLQGAKLELRGAPRGVEVRVGGTRLGSTNGSPDYIFPTPVKPGDQAVEVTAGPLNRTVQRRFEAGQTLLLDWGDVAPAAPASPPPTAEAIEAADWNRVNTSDPAQVRAYLRNHTTGAHAKAAEALLDILVWAATNKDSPESLRAYLREFSSGSHASEANRRIADLVWNGVDQNKSEEVRKFLAENPDSPHKADAQRIIDQLEAEQ